MKHLKAYILIGLIIFSVVNMFVTLPTPTASGEVPWKDQSRDWYYDNLDEIDRQKIRQAMDYLIPREQIINEIHQGFATAITSPIGVNFVGVYEPTIEARENNLGQASALLNEVFGYAYYAGTDETDETTKETNIPYFKITLVCPTTNTLRTRWATLIGFYFDRAGIDTILEWWNWNILMPRIFLDPVGVGYDFEHGGYDAFFVGWDASPDPAYKEYYDKTCFPPSSNCYWIEDGPATSGIWTPTLYPNIAALWTDFYNEMDVNERSLMLKEYQQWCYDQVPTCIIRQEIQPWGLDVSLQGFDLFHGIQQQICNWTGIGSYCTIAQPGDYIDFNPLLAYNYFDEIISSNTFCSLSRRRGGYNITHAVPWLAESWTHTTNYLNWTVALNPNNHWSDGTVITADDVVFTYHAALNATTNSRYRNTLIDILGNDTDSNGHFSAVTKVNDYTVEFVLPEVYPYVETVLFDISILPEHQMSVINHANWWSDATNMGITPIVASGPYQMHQYNGFDSVDLWVNPYYNATAMGHNPTMVGGGNWIPNATDTGHITNVTIIVVKSATTAVTGLITGVYDVIDSWIDIRPFYTDILASGVGKLAFKPDWGYQEMALNHYSPIWGMNPANPSSLYVKNEINDTPSAKQSRSDNASPLNPIDVFFAIIGLTGINLVLRRRK